MSAIRKRVLFVAEAVTLAQVVRLVTLARALPPERFEVHFASAPVDPRLFLGCPFQRWRIDSVSPGQVERSIAWGLRLYDRAVLRRYLRDDLRVIEAVKPDLIVGDLRWSLAVSGPLSGVKVASLANAYWSPFALRDGFPLPEHPIVKLLGVERAARSFPRALPAVFRRFAAPLNALRRENGLLEVGSLLEVLTWGDLTLYADPPGLIPMGPTPANHRFLGAVPWVPAWGSPPKACDRPFVYVTMGSSGSVRVLPAVLEALDELGVDALLATAGRPHPPLPPRVRAVDFVDGALAARAAELVITNGGSSTGYQALAEGTPVVGLPHNLDQSLAMTAIERARAGVLVRSGTATPALVREAVLLARQRRAGARAVARLLASWDAREQFVRCVEEEIGARPSAARTS